AAAANRVLVKLSELLRLTLDRSRTHEQPLELELDFIDRYLEIEQIRFPDRLRVEIDLEDGLLDALVPTLILQPLVENAIRHGIAPDSTAGHLEIRARVLDGNLALEVADDGPGLRAGWTVEQCTGLGLANARQRVERLYGPAYGIAFVPN